MGSKKDERLNYVNYILKNKDAVYNGPKSLFKYRAFDEHTFDMLENKYLFLCVAKKLDDKSECTTVLEIDDLYDKEKDNITNLCLAKIMEKIKPVTNDEVFEQISIIVNAVFSKDSIDGNNYLQILQTETKKVAPDLELEAAVDWVQNTVNKFEDPTFSSKMISLIDIARNARNKIGICSLSADSDNEDVWKRYGANSSGCCIEYDMIGFESANSLLPVIYENKREKDIVLSLLATFMSWLIMGISSNQIQQDVSQFLKLFITKSKKWKRQNEWRILGDANTKIKAPRIKRIIVGKNASKENKLWIAEYCRRNNIQLENQN